jgi:glycosyltransferase involved in cell wall biosynthesis
MNRISIGILAHNESAVIRGTLESLLAQTLFTDVPPERSIELIVVPNGCSDDTAAIARQALTELAAGKPGLTWAVHDIARPGKADAWNDYVHQFSDKSAEALFLLDADIRFIEAESLANMAATFDAEPEAWAVTDVQVKDVALLERKTLRQRISLIVSRQRPRRKYPHGICGQCYAVRADFIRRIHMPAKLPAVEDGFIYSSIITNLFAGPKDITRVVVAPGASHVYEAYTDVGRLLRHERWMITASALLVFVYSELWAAAKAGEDSGTFVARRNAEDPDWLRKLFDRELAKLGWLKVPDDCVWRRFRRLREFPLRQRIVRLPVAAVMQAVDWVALFQANRELRRGAGLGYWGKQQAGPKVAH